MKKYLLILTLSLALTITAHAQDVTLIKHITSDGSLSMMIPDGWHVEESEEAVAGLMMTNKDDYIDMNEIPGPLDPGEFVILFNALDAEQLADVSPELTPDAPFEQRANEIIGFLTDSIDPEFTPHFEKIEFEMFGDGREIALTSGELGDFDAIISLHQVGDRAALSINLAAQGDGQALREMALQILPTIQFVGDEPVLIDNSAGDRSAPNTEPTAKTDQTSLGGYGGVTFAVVGDPLLEVDVRDSAWYTSFARIDVMTPAIQAFNIQMHNRNWGGGRDARMDFFSLPIDIAQGIYTIDENGPIVVYLSVEGDEGEFLSLPLAGTLTIDESGVSIAGSFDLHTKSSPESSVQVTRVTGAFEGVMIPDVRQCVIYAPTSPANASASLHIAGSDFVQVDTDEAVWAIEPRPDFLSLYINSGEGTGAGSYVILNGFHRVMEPGEVAFTPATATKGMSAYLVEVVEAEDGSLQREINVLTGSISIEEEAMLSGSYSLVLDGAPDSHIFGTFNGIPLPSHNCGF